MLAAERRIYMSKFFTYEERLHLQKFLKESLSFKEISHRLDKNPTTISREVCKYSSEVATGYLGFPSIPVRVAFTVEIKISVAKNARESHPYIVSFVHRAMRTVLNS